MAAHPLGHVIQRGGLRVQQLLQPALAPHGAQQVAGVEHRAREVQFFGQQRDILDLDLVQPDLQLAVHLDAAGARAFGVDGVDMHLAAEQPPQARQHPLLAQPFLALGLPAVLGVHIEDQGRGDVAADHPGQQQPGEERFAGAGLAEHAVAALGDPLQVQADRDVHVQRLADREVPLVLRAEDVGEVGLGGVEDRREMHRDGAHRLHVPLLDARRRSSHRWWGRRTARGRGPEAASASAGSPPCRRWRCPAPSRRSAGGRARADPAGRDRWQRRAPCR